MAEKKNKSNDAGKKEDSPTTVVLKMDLHCEGCAQKIRHYLRSIQGVETVKTEIKTGKIIITGKVDPTKVRDKLAKEKKKEVELISPQPKKENTNNKHKKPDNKSKKTDDQKPKKAPATTGVLEVALQYKVVNMTVKGPKMDVEAVLGNLTQKLEGKVVVPPKKDKIKDKEGGRR